MLNIKFPIALVKHVPKLMVRYRDLWAHTSDQSYIFTNWLVSQRSSQVQKQDNEFLVISFFKDPQEVYTHTHAYAIV